MLFSIYRWNLMTSLSPLLTKDLKITEIKFYTKIKLENIKVLELCFTEIEFGDLSFSSLNQNKFSFRIQDR